MKKSILSLLLLSAALCTGCGETGPQGPQGPKGETGPVGPAGPEGKMPEVDLNEYISKNFYDYDFDDEEPYTKVVRPGFEPIKSFDYPILTEEEYNKIKEYSWFEVQLTLTEDKIIYSYNEGYILLPTDWPDFSPTTFIYEIDVYEHNLIETNNRYFEDGNGCEIVFGKDFIIWADDDIYYSEEYLQSKGIEFFDASDILKF